MDLIYLAHPVRPLPGTTETVESNLRDAEWWLHHLQRANPGVAIIAPWIHEFRIGVGDDSDESQGRPAGLDRCRAVVGRCTGIALCGPRISRGMLIEAEALSFSRSLPVFHRFRDRKEDPLFDLRPIAPLDEWGSPIFMHGILYGSVPVTALDTAMELLAAFEAYADEES